MRLAVCGISRRETEQLCGLIRQFCADRSVGAELCPMESPEALWQDFAPGAFAGAVLGREDAAGFLAARRLRELDRHCRILLISDTDRYALRCVRLHVTDFILRPVSRPRLERGLELLFRLR